MTFQVYDGGGEGLASALPAKAEARVAYDLSVRHFQIEVAANREAIEAMRDGLQALLDGASPGYALVVGSVSSPCSMNLIVRPVAIAPTAARWPQDQEAPPDENLW